MTVQSTWATGESKATSAAGGAPAMTSLDDLAAADSPTLTRLYAAGRAPLVGDVKGALRGRMLNVDVLPTSAASVIRNVARQSWFPWKGKTFEPRTESAGSGINRVFSERWSLYPFETFLGRSRAGDFDALQLNYDLPQNPFFIRAIKDEIRTVADGLWLGQAYLHVGSRDHLVLWFALSSRP